MEATKLQEVAAVALGLSGAIEKSRPESAIDRAAEVWSRERIDLIKKNVCPQGIPDGDFSLFLEQCKRTALDPLIKEAFCVKRRVNIGNKDRPVWVDKFEFQPAEAGMAARADKFPDFGGLRGAVVYEGDTIEIDEASGTVSHKSNPIGRAGKKILGAWACCVRSGRVLPVEWCDFGAYVQNTPTRTCSAGSTLRKRPSKRSRSTHLRTSRSDTVRPEPNRSPTRSGRRLRRFGRPRHQHQELRR